MGAVVGIQAVNQNMKIILRQPAESSTEWLASTVLSLWNLGLGVLCISIAYSIFFCYILKVVWWLAYAHEEPNEPLDENETEDEADNGEVLLDENETDDEADNGEVPLDENETDDEADNGEVLLDENETDDEADNGEVPLDEKETDDGEVPLDENETDDEADDGQVPLDENETEDEADDEEILDPLPQEGLVGAEIIEAALSLRFMENRSRMFLNHAVDNHF